MTTFRESLRELVYGNRRFILYAALLTLFLSFYFIIWHYSVISLASGFSILEMSAGFRRIALSYTLVGLTASCLISLVMLALKKKRSKKVFMWIVLVLFFISEFIRMFDWGALYFGGNHIDNNFWAHAFYSDGLVYLLTKESIALYLSVALFFAGLMLLLRGMSAAAQGGSRS